MGRSIPPLLPWQVEYPPGTVHGGTTGHTLTVTVTTAPGSRTVLAKSSEPGTHYVDFGAPGGEFHSADNQESYEYKANGTYTVTMSNGVKSGTAQVTVPGAAEEPEA